MIRLSLLVEELVVNHDGRDGDAAGDEDGLQLHGRFSLKLSVRLLVVSLVFFPRVRSFGGGGALLLSVAAPYHAAGLFCAAVPLPAGACVDVDGGLPGPVPAAPVEAKFDAELSEFGILPMT